MAGFTVAIIGRPNVGKSTLFNRLLERRVAIVDDFSGVTRDRQYGICEWNGKLFNVIDTGGFVSQSDDIFEKEIRNQIGIALEEADLILFLTDVTAGITDMDEELAGILRKTNKPVFLTVNKVDNSERNMEATEFYVFGFEHTFFIASNSGSGTGELLDAVTDLVPEDNQALRVEMEWVEMESRDGEITRIRKEKDAIPKLAIVGKPNVGKSTLLNALTDSRRSIVSNIPGTTRDTIHTRYSKFNKDFILIDTAGIRKKRKVNEDLEFYSVIRAIKAMDEADTCILVIDAQEGIGVQELNILGLAGRKGKGLVILVNKWDLIEEKNDKLLKKFEEEIRSRIAPFKDVPIIFISAKDKLRIYKAMETALEVCENRRNRVATSKLNDILLKEIDNYPPPMARGHNVSIKYVTQLPSYTPTFAFYANFPKEIKNPYKRFLENKIREHFNFTGVPLRIFFRKK